MSPTEGPAQQTERQSRSRHGISTESRLPQTLIRGVFSGAYYVGRDEWAAQYSNGRGVERNAGHLGIALSEAWIDRGFTAPLPIAIVHEVFYLDQDDPSLANFRPQVSEAVLSWFRTSPTIEAIHETPLELNLPEAFRLVIFLTPQPEAAENVPLPLQQRLSPDIGTAIQAALEALAPTAWDALLRERLSPNPADAGRTRVELLGLFQDLQAKLGLLQMPVRKSLQAVLNQISGLSFGSLEKNREIAQRIQELTMALGLRLRCIKCKKAANLRCTAVGNALTGAFQFQHSFAGRITHHAARTTLPPLKLMAIGPGSAGQSGPRSKKN